MIRAGLLLLLAGTGVASDPLAGRVAGAPAECIELDRVQPPEFHDGALLYRQSGTRIWRMTPLERCGRLDDDTRIVAEISGRRFCRGDRFQLTRHQSPVPLGYCRAGSFTPFDRVTGRTG